MRVVSLCFWCGLVVLLGSPSRSLATDRCVDVGDGDFACTYDVMTLRKQLDGKSFDVGVAQRVDGTDAEKEAVGEVLKRMDKYFYEEVLAMPEYEHVRFQW